MYTIEYLPAARQDMVDIVRYIGAELKNPAAAARLADEFIEAGESVLPLPYACPVYHPVRQLRHEYRKLPVKNYLMFYWIDEEKKSVTVARVLYAKSNVGRFLEQTAQDI